ncbi:hypothetical protein EC973_004372 [Apophysomyces ossiformis]|uniref:Cytochrome P450 n=1 Tax=Apophysomyces ossiformis TaxID=679940 RepID=A0A8H7BG46_9FUNG|nr:hypothetical protein EC973_004372 [Apophysomyces ossiformis]
MDLLHLDYIIGSTKVQTLSAVARNITVNTLGKSDTLAYREHIITGFNRAIGRFLSVSDIVILRDPLRFFQEIVINMSAPYLFGCEIEADPELLSCFCDMISSVQKNAPWFYVFPENLHCFLRPLLYDAPGHFQVASYRLMPIVRHHRAKIAEAAARGESYQLGKSFLRSILEHLKSEGTEYSEDDIIGALIMASLALTFTVSRNLPIAFCFLLARPDLRQQLELEIKQVLGDGPITQEGLDKMQFLNAFLHESLRHSQDTLSNRKQALEDYTFINGYQIPKGRMVEIVALQLNVGLNAGFPRAEKLSPSTAKKHSLTTPAKDFVTFSMGKNVCPGRFMAVQQIKIALILLLQKYDITTVSGRVPQPIHYRGGVMAEACNEPLLLKKKK